MLPHSVIFNIFLHKTSRFVLDVNEQNTVSDIVANDGRWHHVAATWESRDGFYRLFLDGELQTSGTGLGNGTIIPGENKFGSRSNKK